MTRSPQEKIPFAAKFFLKRALVWTVGAIVRFNASFINFRNRLINFAVKHGLNYERARRITPYNVHDDSRQFPPFGAHDFLLLTESAARATSREIKTSIIIPVFNKVEYTFQCLRSLVAEIDFDETEVIIVNNASRDETAALLARFADFVHVVNNEENRGFVDACNQGAAEARGKYLVFLNNDTVVHAGWLDALVETAKRDARVGAVGSLFLYPSGMIQEAGAIVWRDGAAHHYGWGGSTNDRRYTFAREVDYCSAASLLIRREIFERLGGFDRRFSPAYYEDVDLCFGVRASGYRVVYQPASRVTHFEGITAGTDTSTGFKRFQVVNQQKFFEKWRDTLLREQLERDLARLEEAANRRRAPQVVVFDDRVPTPDRDAGSARMFFILKSLARWSHVVFVPMTRGHGTEYERQLWREGIETASLVEYPRLLSERNFYAAVFSRPHVADALMGRVKRAAPATKIVFDMVDAYFIRLGREYEVNRNEETRAEAARYQEIETRLARASDLVWCNSTEDKRVMERLAPGVPIEVIPTIHETREPGKTFDERRGLLFVGNFRHRPNTDGLNFFMREVFPVVQEEIPDARLTIVGDYSSPEILAHASESVSVTGYVPDIEPYFEAARVFVAPIRFGAGVKGKIGEALAHGLPLVTTTVGAEGMGLEHETHAMIANEARSFADAVVRLYREPELWRKISENGRTHVEKNFSPAIVEKIVNAPLLQLGGRKPLTREEAG